MLLTVNNGDNSFTGTSGTVAWELEDQNVHLIVMWSVPYNLNIYNSYFGIGVVQLTTRFTRDMLPYWYKQMIEHKQGRTFQRGVGGGHLVYKHEDFFAIGEFGTGYHPLLNIRYFTALFICYLYVHHYSPQSHALANTGLIPLNMAQALS